MKRNVVILGGYGVFGGRIASSLAELQLPDVSLIIAGRNSRKGEAFARSLDAAFVHCDWGDPAALRRSVEDAFLVIHAAGPFSDATHLVARACLAAGVHYLDIADGRAHVSGISALSDEAQRRNVFLCAGASATPAVTSAIVRELAADGVHIRAIHGFLSPGNQNPRGVSTIATVLGYVGRPISTTVDGQIMARAGWFDGEEIALPPPVGRRRVYTVDAPDLALFPAHFGAQTVTFKAGLELNVMNYGLALLARLRRRGWLRGLTNQAGLFTRLSWLLFPFGSPHGAIAVRIEGEKEGRPVRRRLAIVAEADGPLVAAAPAVLLAQRLLTGHLPERGAFPCLELVDFAELMDFLSRRGFKAFREDEAGVT